MAGSLSISHGHAADCHLSLADTQAVPLGEPESVGMTAALQAHKNIGEQMEAEPQRSDIVPSAQFTLSMAPFLPRHGRLRDRHASAWFMDMPNESVQGEEIMATTTMTTAPLCSVLT